ncbi:MAG: hypothetical protein ACON30_03820 [Flavobacteriaceae bacterium]
MKTKLKDILLYSLAIIGTASLFISATNQSTSQSPTTPESHVWELKFAETQALNWAVPYLYNKQTGEVRKYDSRPITYDKKGNPNNNFMFKEMYSN